MDFSSRYPEAIPLRQVTAQTVTDAMVATFSRFGIPEEVLTDNGSVFVAKLTQFLLKALGVRHIKISPYHPQSNSMLERWHRVLKTIITKTCQEDKQWEDVLPVALFACRDAPHAATGLSPFEILFGWQVRGPTSILKEIWTTPKRTPASVVAYLEKLRTRMELTTQVVAELDAKAKESSKRYYDQTARDDPLQEGDEVLILHPASPKGIMARRI